MKQTLAHLHARVQAWADIHWRGEMPRFARVKAWALAKKGDYGAAADLWGQIAQNTAAPTAAAIGRTRQGRYLLFLERGVEAEVALTRAIELRPGYAPALEPLAKIAMQREHWAAAAEWLQALIGANLGPAEQLEALRMLGVALAHQGRFDEATEIIERLAQNEHGRRAALELRLAMAAVRMDEDGERAAWHEMLERFPAVADSPGYMAFVGGEDGADAARYSAADLAEAKDVSSARLILAYLGHRLPMSAYLDLLRETTERFSGDAGLQARYIQWLLWNLNSPRELKAAQTRARDFCARFPRHGQGPQLVLRAAVAANDVAAAAGLLEASQTEQGHDGAANFFQIWLAAKRGEQTQAKALDRQLRRNRYLLGLDSRGLDLNPITPPPQRAARDKILLFTALRNERLFLPWFLGYYRALGVDRFFIVDNGSDDGSMKYLTTQKDCVVYASANNYRATLSGAQWINELIRRHGIGNWCVYVDADEQLVAPDIETRGLRGVVDDMAARGEEVMPAYMLDTYPPDMASLSEFRPGDSPLEASRLLDADYFFFGVAQCCFFRAAGGARNRLFGTREKIEKAPILRGGACWYLDSHNTTYARASRERGVLLHHKILREALDMARPQTRPGARIDDRIVDCRMRHARYRGSGLLAMSSELPRGPSTLAYQDSAQLARLGLIGDFTAIKGGAGAVA